MKAHGLKLATVAVALCALALIVTGLAGVSEVGTLATALLADHGHGLQLAQLLAIAALPQLRTQHADLVTRATAKMNEITEGMASADVTRITGEHDALVRQYEDVQRQIATAEAEEARTRTTPTMADQIRTAVSEAVGAERVRTSTLRDIGTRARMADADVLAAINDPAVTVESFRTRAFDALVTGQPGPTSSVRGGDLDETLTRRAGMAEALAFRMSERAPDGVARIAQPSNRARGWIGMGIVEMAAEAIGHRGHLRTAAQVDEVLRRSFMSTSDFPGIFGTAMNARLLARYQAALPAYRRFAAQYNATDFRAMPIIRAGDFPTLQAVPETGVIPSGTFSESKETMSVSPKGVTFNLSRAMFINDNLGAIEQIMGSAGTRVTDWENAQLFASLVSASHLGPTLLTDSTAVFDDTAHGNHVASGTAISIASIGLGRAAMMKQTSLDGLKLNLAPVTLLCGPDRATDAEQLVTQITPAAVANAVPDWMKRLQVVADANITGNHWYLFADVAVAPCWVYGMLDGSAGPRLTTDDPFTIQGLSVKLEHDFGTAAMDYRGAYHNAGAAPA